MVMYRLERFASYIRVGTNSKKFQYRIREAFARQCFNLSTRVVLMSDEGYIVLLSSEALGCKVSGYCYTEAHPRDRFSAGTLRDVVNEFLTTYSLRQHVVRVWHTEWDYRLVEKDVLEQLTPAPPHMSAIANRRLYHIPSNSEYFDSEYVYCVPVYKVKL